MRERIKYILYLIIIVALAVGLSLVLDSLGIRKENSLMVFIVAVLLVATFTQGYLYSIAASILSVLFFNYFFTIPQYNFHMSDSNDVMLLFFFLIASFIACNLTDRLLKQVNISRKNEKISHQLYILTERLLNISGIENILKEGELYLKESTGLNTNISLDIKEQSDNIYPIISLNKTIGIIEVVDQRFIDDDNKLLLKASANQLANALEREMTYQQQERIKLEMEREHMMNSMLKSISHDLRTPLTGIVGASSLICNKKDLDRSDINSLSQDIHEQAKWLTQIVENILNMSKIDSGSLIIHKNLEAVDDLVSEAIRLVNDLENRNFIVDIPDELIFVNVDGKLIIQVLVNLLNNSIKYTQRNDTIWLRVNKHENSVHFIIEDTGIGIHESIEGNLFDEFVTYPGISADSQKGIGLGLAICHAVIKAHGGIISAKNNKEKGACFEFVIYDEKELDIHE